MSRPTLAIFKKRFLLGLLALASTACGRETQPTPATAATPRVRTEVLDSLEAYVREGMSRWGVPGLALGIVQGGDLIWARGFGFRDPGFTLEVTPETAFSLASLTKAFTAITLGLLVEDGFIGWDEPIHDRVPEFRLASEELTGRVTLRDILSHRTGLQEKPSLWTAGELRAEEIFLHLDELEPVGEFRNHHEYSNVLYIGGAVLAEYLSGERWDALARRRILAPLGMASTGFSVEELLAEPEFSPSFSVAGGAYEANEFPGPEHNAWYFPRASGSMYSTVRDMARWMTVQLEAGVASGTRIASGETVRQTHLPAIPLPAPPFYVAYPGIQDHAYGLGWYLDTYRGHRRIHHGGASMGYSNYLTLFPEDDLGLVILSNREVLFPVELMYVASDLLLGLEPEDWKGRFAEYVPGSPYLGQDPPGKTAQVFAPGRVSTRADEVMYPVHDFSSLFIFSRAEPDFDEDWIRVPLYRVHARGGIWGDPEPAGAVGLPWYLGYPEAPEGTVVYFPWRKNLDGSGPPMDIDLWRVGMGSTTWGQPERLEAPINGESFDSWPSVSEKGSLYFFSRREGGLGRIDLYRAEGDDAGFSDPTNLGPGINTEFNDHDPFVAPDESYLLFCSDRPGGFGGNDLFVSFRGPGGAWTRPANLGAGVNSPADETRPFVTPDGAVLFFSGTAAGSLDIFWVDAGVIKDLNPFSGPPRSSSRPPGPNAEEGGASSVGQPQRHEGSQGATRSPDQSVS